MLHLFYSIILTFLLSPTNQASSDYPKYNCDKCISLNGRYCLFDGDYTTGTCCDPRNLISNSCKYQHLNRVCATNAMSNKIV